MISFLKLIRYKNLIMILLTMILTKYALIHSVEKLNKFDNLQFVLLTISILFISAGGYVINDIFDIEADKINKKNGAIIGQDLSIKIGWFSYLSLTSIGLLSGLYISIINNLCSLIWIYIFSIIALYFYSFYLKKIALIGNVLIALLCSLTILIIYAFQNAYATSDVKSHVNLYKIIIVYSCFSFLSTLIREIIKDIEDVDGDLKLKAKTLPIVLGRKRAKYIAVILSVILLISLIQIATNYLYTTPILLGYTFVFILMPLSYFTYQLYNADTKKQFHFLSNFMKVIMFLGILSMILFKFQ